MSTKSIRTGDGARGRVDIVDVVDMVRGVLQQAKRGDSWKKEVVRNFRFNGGWKPEPGGIEWERSISGQNLVQDRPWSPR